LTDVHNQAMNARGGGGDLVGRYNAYMRWAHESVRVLRRQVTPDSLDRLVLTRTYWALQAQAASVVGPVGELVETELEDRVTVLDQARQDLDREIARWSRPGLLVVADSSFYIHHAEKLEQLDLREHLKIREEPVRLLLPILVVDELDNLKESKDPRVRWRARYTLAVVDRVLQDPFRGRVREEDFSVLQSGGIPRGEITIELVFDPAGHVRLPINDDEIIDRALAIQTLAMRPVTLLTYDTGQSTRARAAGLREVKIPQPAEGPEPQEAVSRRR
jgi:hypothetical protein